MEIFKRDGTKEKYNEKKIKNAVKAAFKSINQAITEDELKAIVLGVYENIKTLDSISVEEIQDLVEKEIMKQGHYEAFRSFVLYRDMRTQKRKTRMLILKEFEVIDLNPVIKGIEKRFTDKAYDMEMLYNKYLSFSKEGLSDNQKLNLLITASCELTSQEAPRWEFIASMFLMKQFEIKLAQTLRTFNINSFYDKIVFLTKENLYGSYILEHYTKEEIDKLEKKMDVKRNNLLTYSSLRLLLSRYVIRTRDGISIETPQEMFMGIAMHLGMNEPKETRLDFVYRLYDILSSLKVTMATPTMSNARKPFHQLSSCFIDTVPDSLESIYRSITNFAKVSKMGGGMGMYFGKVRATGSDIRGFKGAAGGVVRWIRLVNDTAVAVDQLGMRQGAVAVYLDLWHRDILEFLQLRTTNGDERLKAHDVFPAICVPNLFWQMARDNINGMWYLMCPHEVKTIKGYSLEDYYGKEWEEKYYDCIEDPRIIKKEISVKDLVRLIIKSAVETGTPFIFNRDIVNEFNTNPDKGMIYSSNLCTEIAQNMSPIIQGEKRIQNKDGEIIITEETKAGDFVVCNLASLVLGNIDVKNNAELEYITSTIVKALDNVIDLNYYPLKYAKVTNGRYRPIGLGISGYHHMLAKNGIAWESEEHLTFVDELFERINYYTIKASNQLAKEKGSYPLFEGSDWSNGKYFEKRNYTSKKWQDLSKEVQKTGIRNAYLLAIAPTSSTSILAGTTAGVDPIMKRYFLEEKKGAIIPRVAPDLTMRNFWLYKNAHTINQDYSIKACGIRQRHIDQAQSMNMYITNDYTMRQILHLYILSWEQGVKTIYYFRSKSLEVEECDSCSA